jgi:helix-turn-helix protein
VKTLELGAVPSQLFTQKEAAELLGVDETTLWRWRKAKAITYRKRGPWIRYTAEDIQLFLDESAVEAIKSKKTAQIQRAYQNRQSSLATPANVEQKTEKEKEILEKPTAWRDLCRWLLLPEADAVNDKESATAAESKESYDGRD